MPGVSSFNRFKQAVGEFASNTDGNLAVIFAIVLIPVLTFVGAAIDYSRAVKSRTAMQSALDSTALMLSKDLSAGIITASQINAKAQSYFTALYTDRDAQSPAVTATYTAASGSTPATVLVNGSASIITAFMRIAGFPTMGFNANSTASWGANLLRVALVLDNTGSMAQSGKMTALKSAATSLVSQLSNLAANNGDVYISVVPFEIDVNVGTSNVNANWLRWDLWDPSLNHCSGGTNATYMSYAACLGHNYSWNHTVGSPNKSQWSGCVTDRDQSYDVNGTAPSSNPTNFIADQEQFCPAAQVLPLTYTWANVNNTINAMSPNGATNQTIGLLWGWLSLMQQSPLNAPSENSTYTYQHIIILFTDGLNTGDRWYGDLSATSTQVDNRMRTLCDNIKAVIDPNTNRSKYIIYTVQIDTDGAGQSAVLPYCATDASHFFMLTSASQIAQAFAAIGTQISKLRVAR
jgi:Flp pilus assembly protein TadG